MSDDDAPSSFASPPCFMHELDPAWLGFTPEPDAATRRDVARWRKAERERLIAARMALLSSERERRDARLAARLTDLATQLLGTLAGRTIGLYWPFRAEPDLRPWMRIAHAAGATCALPVVVEKARPLLYRPWTPTTRLTHGVWRIPIPAEGNPVHPDLIVAPLVGFDAENYRLGYGGGFFDRTLASLDPQPIAIGIGYAESTLPTIYPQPHDIPMQHLLIEAGPAEQS